jgi:ribonuclease P protein component
MNHFSLPKSSLLRKTQDYNQTYKKGKRIQGDNFSLIFSPNNESNNRLGISIHGQIKGGVRRNRIKRIIREFFRTNRTFLQQWAPNSTILPMMDIIFTVRKGFYCHCPHEVGQAVFNCLQGTPAGVLQRDDIRKQQSADAPPPDKGRNSRLQVKM